MHTDARKSEPNILAAVSDTAKFSVPENAIDDVVVLEAALYVPAAIVGRNELEVIDGGQARGEHAPVASSRNITDWSTRSLDRNAA